MPSLGGGMAKPVVSKTKPLFWEKIPDKNFAGTLWEKYFL
jgi:hypothetical protein